MFLMIVQIILLHGHPHILEQVTETGFKVKFSLVLNSNEFNEDIIGMNNCLNVSMNKKIEFKNKIQKYKQFIYLYFLSD